MAVLINQAADRRCQVVPIGQAVVRHVRRKEPVRNVVEDLAHHPRVRVVHPTRSCIVLVRR